MKNITLRKIIPVAFATVAFVACKQPNPEGKSVYGTVKAVTDIQGPDQKVYVNLENKETLVLQNPGKTYQVGDTIWFYYDAYVKNNGVISTYNVFNEPAPDFKQFVIRQQKELYGKNR